MDDPDDVARCTRCGRWQRRKYAHAEDFGPGDREEWCVTGGCFATWADGVAVALRARHDPDDVGCVCASCREASGVTPDVAVLLWAADRGYSGDLGDVRGIGELERPSN